MSLIIAESLRDCVIIGGDRRATYKMGNETRYADNVHKVFPFSKNCAVAFCGDLMVTQDITVETFLMSIKNKYVFKSDFDYASLPITILNEYRKFNVNADIVFIAAWTNRTTNENFVYYISTRDLSIVSYSNNYYTVYEGVTDICDAIMKNCTNYDQLGVNDGIELMEITFDTTIKAAKYWPSPTVGGGYDIYVLPKFNEIEPIEIHNPEWKKKAPEYRKKNKKNSVRKKKV